MRGTNINTQLPNMMMELTILGTSSMVPTKERNVSGYFLSVSNEGILLDCGEGTQRQMNIAGIKRTNVTRVLLSHWHGDHVAGLVGLLQTIGNAEPDKIVYVHGPKGTKKHVKHMLQSCVFENKIKLVVNEHDIKKRTVIKETQDWYIEAAPMTHSIPCIGYAISIKESLRIDVEKAKRLGIGEGPWMKQLSEGENVIVKGKKIKPEQITKIKSGKKIVYIPDTTPNKYILELAQDAEVMLIESTYDHDLQEKAEKYQHLTAVDCANMAQQANVKRLVLTHFSQRYKTTKKIEEDARSIFPEAVCAYDFMKIKI